MSLATRRDVFRNVKRHPSRREVMHIKKNAENE